MYERNPLDSCFLRRRPLVAVAIVLLCAWTCLLPERVSASEPHRQDVARGAAPVPPDAPEAADIVRDPSDLPSPIKARAPALIRVPLTVRELEGTLDPLMDGTYRYWTFDGKVPGPMVRVREGDTVEVTLRNPAESQTRHSVDFHAALGPGGGSAFTQVDPGQEKTFTFQARIPGVFVYHCGTDMMAEHIANGMYGLIVVEPAAGLAPVQREFYVMQGEIYTTNDERTGGHQTFSHDRLMDERPSIYVFNGAIGALTTEHPLKAQVGDTVRIFFGDGGPNKMSSFHVVGQVLRRVYQEGSLSSPPLQDVQTTIVPPGSATMVEFQTFLPGRYTLLDHAMTRMTRNLVGYLTVTGPDNSEIFHAGAVDKR